MKCSVCGVKSNALFTHMELRTWDARNKYVNSVNLDLCPDCTKDASWLRTKRKVLKALKQCKEAKPAL